MREFLTYFFTISSISFMCITFSALAAIHLQLGGAVGLLLVYLVKVTLSWSLVHATTKMAVVSWVC